MPAGQQSRLSTSPVLGRVKDVLNRAGISDEAIAAGIHLPPRGIQIVADYVGIPQDEVPLLVMELSVKLKATASSMRAVSGTPATSRDAARTEVTVQANEKEGTLPMPTQGGSGRDTQARASVEGHNERMSDIYETCMAYVDAVASGEVSPSDLGRIDGITKLMQVAISASAAMVHEAITSSSQVHSPDKAPAPEPRVAMNDRGSELFEKQSRFSRPRPTESSSPPRSRAADPDEQAPLAFPEARARRRFAPT